MRVVRSPWILGVGAATLLAAAGCGSGLSDWAKQQCRYDRACMEACERTLADGEGDRGCARAFAMVAGPEVDLSPPRRPRQSVKTISRTTSPMTPQVIAQRSIGAIVVLRTDKGMGSGFAAMRPGRIVTNLHVIAGATKIEAFLTDGERLEVQGVLGWDTVNDLALVKIEEGLPMLTLSAGPAQVGEPVVVIGNPLGFAATVSDGLVSGLRADASSQLVQISAPIAPGSSGGPVIGSHGDVVGVAVATIRGGQNLNFAIPANYAAALIAGEELTTIEAFSRATQPTPKGPDTGTPGDAPAAPDLAGCSVADRKYLALTLKEAMDAGSALCASKKDAACFHVYEGAALDAEKGISTGCAGPRSALAKARAEAASVQDPGERARALARTVGSVLAAATK